MQKSTFIKYIQSLNEEELKHELENLYAFSPDVKQFYIMELGSEKDRQRIYNNIKKDIESKYVTRSLRRPRKPRISKIRAILRNLERQKSFTYELGEVFLFNVECATKYVKAHWIITDPIRNIIFETYEKACLYIRDALMEDTYMDRINECIVNVQRHPLLSLEMEKIRDRVFD